MLKNCTRNVFFSFHFKKRGKRGNISSRKIMNNLQLNSILKSDCRMKNVYTGVFPSNRLPKFVEEPAALIANTQPSSMPGAHWVAFFINNDKKCEYFDSYGFPPSLYPEFLQFLRANYKNPRNWTYNKVHLQGLDSDVCGHYCLAFLMAKACGSTMDAFVRQFGTDTERNDAKVAKMIRWKCGNSSKKTENECTLTVQSCICRRRNKTYNSICSKNGRSRSRSSCSTSNTNKKVCRRY
jgi:hypothetical protein